MLEEDKGRFPVRQCDLIVRDTAHVATTTSDIETEL
jgi:hypothetical protein